jgi:hypothetical protein
MMLMLKILAVIAICAFMVGVVRLLEDFDHKLSTFIETHNGNVQTINNKFANTNNRLTHIEAKMSLVDVGNDRVDKDINNIIARLNAITDDIARIDRDEKEIRSYYVNYREPVPVSTGGVAWANEFVCGEETDE